MIRLVLLILLILTTHFSFCYCQVFNKEDHYYDQFPEQRPAGEQDNPFTNVIWILIPALIICFAYYLTAGRDDALALQIFYALILLALMTPLLRLTMERTSLISKENQTRYSINPIYAMKAYPITYGMTRVEVEEKWGSPRLISSQLAGQEEWLYSREEPSVKFRIGGKYWFAYIDEWFEFYRVILIFRDGILLNSEPDLESINKAKVPKIKA